MFIHKLYSYFFFLGFGFGNSFSVIRISLESHSEFSISSISKEGFALG